MKKNVLHLLSCSLMATILLSACASAAPSHTPGLSETNVAATINAAVQATNATGPKPTSPTTTEPVPATTPTVPPTPPADTASMSEEELAAAIDAAVAKALASTETAATTAAEATSDGTLTAQESATVEIAFANADEAIALAETLIIVYADLYGEYASETMAVLLEIEQDLETLADATAAILALLEEGSEAASAAIGQIEAALESAQVSADEIQSQTSNWLETLEAELQNRATKALAVEASEVATTRREALESTSRYVKTVRTALTDQRISPEELANIAQVGANARASLQAQGGQLAELSGAIETLTTQIAQGQWTQAQTGLGSLESSLPQRP